jgi:hypothetical protein
MMKSSTSFGSPDAPKARNHTGRPKDPGLAVKVEIPDDGAPEELQWMRHVLANHRKWDTLAGQRNARLKMEKTPKVFYDRLDKLEAEHKASKVAETEDLKDTDAGTAKCLELAEQLVKELAGKHK